METNYTAKVYLITMLYDEPRGASIRVAAESREKALELLKKQFGTFKNFEVAQCIAEDEIKPTPFTTTENAPVLTENDDDNETPPSQRLH